MVCTMEIQTILKTNATQKQNRLSIGLFNAKQRVQKSLGSG